MKIFFRVIIFLLLSNVTAKAQQWSFATGDSADTSSTRPQNVVAASRDAVMWGNFVNPKMPWAPGFVGDYKMTEYDTAGVTGNSINITGKVYLFNAQCDDAGNYYVTGYYYDTIKFPGGFQETRLSGGDSPEYFVFRLDKGTLALNWFKFVGIDFSTTANNFTIKNGGLYIFVDSGGLANNLYRYDLATGDRNLVLTQSADGHVTSVQLDDNNNIYVAGSPTNTGAVNFNGHTVYVDAALSYPTYVTRYKADGTYDWSLFTHGVTVEDRKLTIADNNEIYYSGPVNDSFSLGSYTINHGAWVYAYFVSMIDSTGAVQWVSQLPDTLAGDASVSSCHTTIGPDSSLNVISSVRDYINWGHGVISSCNNNGTATVVNYSTSGVVRWALSANATYSDAERIATDGKNLWVAGIGYDSTAMKFGSFSIPSVLYHNKPYLAKINPIAIVTEEVKPVHFSYVGIHPDPATTVIHVDGDIANDNVETLRLISMTGKVLYSKRLIASIKDDIDVSTYPRGVYILEIESNGLKSQYKIILQ